MATILIVEDESQISSLLQSLFEEHGHKTLAAGNADQAFSILARAEVVDALFVDIILNGDMQAGIEFAKRAIELNPGIKVLYSTGLTVTDVERLGGAADSWIRSKNRRANTKYRYP
jgi:DNA-binding NtrC family response regulator